MEDDILHPLQLHMSCITHTTMTGLTCPLVLSRLEANLGISQAPYLLFAC